MTKIFTQIHWVYILKRLERTSLLTKLLRDLIDLDMITVVQRELYETFNELRISACLFLIII